MDNELGRVMDALPGMVWSALPDGRFDYFNKRWCDYTGLHLNESYGTGWLTAVHPQDLPHLVERWRWILTTGKPQQMEARLRGVDGDYRRFVFHINPLADPSGRIAKWCGINAERDDEQPDDGTRGAEWCLSPRDHFRSVLDGLPALVTLMAPTGELEFANRQVLEYFGRTLDQLKGWATSDAVHKDDLPTVMAAWKRSLDTGEPYDIEHRIRRADGMYRWFHMRGFPLRDESEHIVFWYHLQNDIDDRKRAEMLLAGEKLLLELVASSHSMSTVLDGVCHLVEKIASGCYCSIVLVDPSGTHLEHGAAPSLPSSFIESIIGRPVNIDSGPCAMAAYLNEQVVADNLATETRWADYEWCPMAMAHGLYACWSTPICSTAGKVLGAFAIYYDQPRTPNSLEQSLIKQFSHIASIAVERAQGDEALKRSEARKAAILSSALDCIVTIDHKDCITEFNPAAERTFGYHRVDVLGRSLADVIVPPAFRGQHQRGFARYLATGDTSLLGRRRTHRHAR
jgi:PAS domain S-box-containing protein